MHLKTFGRALGPHGMSILGKDCFKLEGNSLCVIFICQVGGIRQEYSWVITWNPTPSHSSAAEAAAWTIALCEETQPKTTRSLITWRRLRWKAKFIGKEEPSHLFWCFQELYWHLLAVGLQCESWPRRPASPQHVHSSPSTMHNASTSIRLPNFFREVRPRTFTVVPCKPQSWTRPPAVPCKHIKM